MPRNRPGSSPFCLRVEEWPINDQAAWRAAMQGADPFGPVMPASNWSERSRTKTARGYGRWLRWLFENGWLVAQQSAGDRITPALVQAYVDDLTRVNNNKGFTIVCRVQELYDAARVMAPDRDWRWLQQAHNAVRTRCVPVRDKRMRVQPTGELVKLGRAMMQSAESAVDKPLLTRAVQFRDGLMIAFLTYRPLRLANLAAISLGVHLIRLQQGNIAGAEADFKRGLELAPELRPNVEILLRGEKGPKGR